MLVELSRNQSPHCCLLAGSFCVSDLYMRLHCYQGKISAAWKDVAKSAIGQLVMSLTSMDDELHSPEPCMHSHQVSGKQRILFKSGCEGRE